MPTDLSHWPALRRPYLSPCASALGRPCAWRRASLLGCPGWAVLWSFPVSGSALGLLWFLHRHLPFSCLESADVPSRFWGSKERGGLGVSAPRLLTSFAFVRCARCRGLSFRVVREACCLLLWGERALIFRIWRRATENFSCLLNGLYIHSPIFLTPPILPGAPSFWAFKGSGAV